MPRKVLPLSCHPSIRIQNLPELISRFLYEQKNPNSPIPVELIATDDLPEHDGKIFVYSSAMVIFHAPSDVSGTRSMRSERIRSTAQWWGGPACRDCIFIEHSAEVPGFCGLYIAQVEAFLKVVHERKDYPCAVVSWFSTMGDTPCRDTGLWMVKRDLDRGSKVMSIIHLDTILRGAHLIGISGKSFVPKDMHSTDSLTAFRTFFVNKYIDYRVHEIAW